MTTTASDERRSQILDAATRVFAEKGFASTTMDDVASAIGYTKPVIYDHFQGKDALYTEIIRTTADRMMRLLREAVEKQTEPRKKVEAAFRVYFELVVTESDAFRVLFLQAGSTERSVQLRAVEVDMVSFIEPMLPPALDDNHKRELAGGVVGMAEGAAVVWLVRRERTNDVGTVDDAHQLAKRIATLAWGGLRAVQPK
jgi:AcrR family transcriptional regulator